MAIPAPHSGPVTPFINDPAKTGVSKDPARVPAYLFKNIGLKQNTLFADPERRVLVQRLFRSEVALMAQIGKKLTAG